MLNARALAEYERCGALSSAARHEAAHVAYSRCAEGVAFSLSTAASARGALLLPGRAPTHVSSVQFDSQGALLACALSTGGVQVLDFLELRSRTSTGSGSRTVAPILRLTRQRQVEALRWCPCSQDVIAAASAADGDVHLFDLGVCDEAPTDVLLGEAQTARAPPGVRTTTGLGDVAFFHADSRKVLAAGHAGKVFLWDTRTGHRPRASLTAPRSSGQLLSLQLAADDQVVHVAGASGEIYCWDLRGGRQATTAFVAPNQVTFPLLHVLNVTALLLDVPGLADEVHALALDPCDGRRLAFQLACGWSGVINQSALAITHVHCPPPPWLENPEPQSAAQWAIKHRPAWSWNAAAYLTGTHTADVLRVLDFAATPRAGCHVGVRVCAAGCAADRPCRSCQPPQALRTSAPVVAVAAHPLCDDIVVGTQGGNVELLAGRAMPDADAT